MIKINTLYLMGAATGLASVLMADGIEASVTWGGMLGHAVLSLLLGALALGIVGLANGLEMELESQERLRHAHRPHARPCSRLEDERDA